MAGSVIYGPYDLNPGSRRVHNAFSCWTYQWSPSSRGRPSLSSSLLPIFPLLLLLLLQLTHLFMQSPADQFSVIPSCFVRQHYYYYYYYANRPVLFICIF
ncbi:hypothetical protein GOODEAATRI_003129 [Goodea atripinnis]|uniref:Uncharacterized protein n=1 Tax=Goodea atripinnis TaxID=208336 RepID=A0ABV0PAX7_9TELE